MSKQFRGRLLAAIFSAGFGGGLAAQAHAETLADAIAEAYANNPNLQAQRATQRALDETYVQARTGWRPTLSVTGEAAYEDNRLAQGYFSPFTRSSSIERGNSGLARLSFSQPIWTGGRVAAAVTAANADVLQGRENLRRLEGQVLAAVVQYYVDVRRDQEGVHIQEDNVRALQAQLDESRARFDVGDVTRTDVAQSESRLEAAKAQLQSAIAQLAVSRANYAAIVGHNPGELAPEPSLAYLLPANVDDAYTVAETNSPVLRAQEFAEQASRARVQEARADRMPSVSVQSTLTFSGAPIDPLVPRAFTKDVTSGVVVNIPLFSGGLTNSRVRQQIERNNADRITIETERRSVLQTVTQTWNQLLAARANITSTDQGVRAAAIAYEGTKQEQQAGLRSTIDVLNAEQELRSAQLNQISARHDEYLSAANVLLAMGRLEAKNLIPAQPQYDPARNFRRLRLTWGWVPWEEPIAVVDRFGTLYPAPQPHLPPVEKAAGAGLQQQPVTDAPVEAPLSEPELTTVAPGKK